MKEIKMSLIAKIQFDEMRIFAEEDEDYPNYKRIRALERAIWNNYLAQITPHKTEQLKIYKAIKYGSWNLDDLTYKPICDELRKLGYTIVEGK